MTPKQLLKMNLAYAMLNVSCIYQAALHWAKWPQIEKYLKDSHLKVQLNDSRSQSVPPSEGEATSL